MLDMTFVNDENESNTRKKGMKKAWKCIHK